MRQTTAQCTQLELIGDREQAGFVRGHFGSDLRLAPGQFALARLSDTYDPYLRQPFFPSHLFESGFTVDFAPTAPALGFIWPGAVVDLIGPIGLALPDIPDGGRVLLIAENDPAVLLPLAARAIEAGGTATLLLATRYPLDALRPEIELRLGDLASLAAEYAPTADLVFIHTGRALHSILYRQFTAARTLVTADYARALVQCPLPCGLGACGACAVKTARGWKPACTGGPFFSLSDLDIP